MEIFDYFSKEEIDQLLLDILSIESHKEYGNKELDAAKWIYDFFEKENINVKLEEVEENRLNVMASLGNIKNENIPLMLNGHIDTVPGSGMSYEPFNPFIKNGKVYGRGSAGMKGGLVAMMVALSAAKRSHFQINENIVFAGVVDEEESSMGTEELVNRGYQPEHVIFGEPTQLDICTAHKGMEWVEVTFYGESAHGARPKEGINAVYAASEFCNAVEHQFQNELEKRVHPQLGSGTISIGRISGGTDPNVVPHSCKVEIDRRWLPEENIKDVNDEIIDMARQIAGKRDARFGFRVMNELTASMGNHPYSLSSDDNFYELVTEVSANIRNKSIEQKGFEAWSDAGILGVQTNAKCLILGPGNIDQAHANDEYCSLEDIYQASAIYFNVIKKIAGNVNEYRD